MRNSALGYFGAMCTLKTAFSKTTWFTKLNCETLESEVVAICIIHKYTLMR